MLGAEELVWIADSFTASGTAWSLAARIVVPALLIMLISSRAADDAWPVRNHLAAYRRGAVMVLVGARSAFWSLHINFAHGGSSEPLPYLPVMNAIDLGHLLGIFAVTAWWMSLRRSDIATPPLLQHPLGITWAGIVLFIWLNAILLRTIHHWNGVAYDSDSLMELACWCRRRSRSSGPCWRSR